MSVMLTQELKSEYCSEIDNLGQDFFVPCLTNSKVYHRAAGYFSTGALRSWAGAIKNLLLEKVSIRLLISPELPEKDWNMLRNATDPEKRANFFDAGVERFLAKAMAWSEGLDPSEQELGDLLTWLVAKEKLEIRFAFNLSNGNKIGIFHKKIGIFTFHNDTKVAFTGSANESWSGHGVNAESIDVFRSWVAADNDRVTSKEREFQRCWDPVPGTFLVRPISQALLERIKSRSKIIDGKKRSQPSFDPEEAFDGLWTHQRDGCDALLSAKRGVLEMATGTGKTRTAISILKYLFVSEKITSAIVAMNGNDLLRQWEGDLRGRLTSTHGITLLKGYESTRHEERFMLNPKNKILLCSRANLQHLIKQLGHGTELPATAIIHDEVHDLGSPGNLASLAGHGNYFDYRVGLSATPERDYDKDGNDFIESEIGPVIFKYSLEDAIRDEVLCPFDYHVVPYELTQEDRKDLSGIYAREHAAAKAGKPWPPEKRWIEISRVYKRARMKPHVFRDFLEGEVGGGVLANSIIFVEDKEFSDDVFPVLIDRTNRYSSYFDHDPPEVLERFARGELDCLVTCHKLSQGIDLPSLQNVILFSSQRGRRETIQRLGRCLRRDPGNPEKVARVIDFQLVGDNSNGPLRDDERVEWLDALSRVRPNNRN